MLAFWINCFFATFFAAKGYSREKKLVIIFEELIGDYVLFRNFLQSIRESRKYRNYKITLVCNSLCKELATFLDSQYVDEFIWVNIKKFRINCFYRYIMLIYLSRKTFTDLVVPNDSREIATTDLLALSIQAENKISAVTCDRNIGQSPWNLKQKHICNTWYNKLLEVDYTKPNFAFYIRSRIISSIIEEPVKFYKPEIILPTDRDCLIKIDGDYVIMAIGSGSRERRWPLANILDTINFILKSNSSYSIVLCGSKQEKVLADEIVKNIGETHKAKLINICGKTSLVDLLYILAKSKLLIGNDSSAVHMAVALEASGAKNEIFVIFPGKKFTRFVPYPKDITLKYHVVCHSNFEKEKGKVEYDYFINLGSTLPMNEIHTNQLIDILKNKIARK